jgi:acetyltransferase
MKLGQRIAHERLSRVAFIDYNREMTLVATTMPPAGEAPDILSAGRLIKMHGRGEAEFSVMVVDDKQGHGIGTEVLRRLVEIGRDEGLKRIIGYVLSENTGMLHLIEQLGFKRQAVKDDPNIIKVTLEL